MIGVRVYTRRPPASLALSARRRLHRSKVGCTMGDGIGECKEECGDGERKGEERGTGRKAAVVGEVDEGARGGEVDGGIEGPGGGDEEEGVESGSRGCEVCSVVVRGLLSMQVSGC